MKLLESAYDWAVIPDDLPRQNLVLITAKTTHPTFHYTDPKYKIRKFTPEELKEAARSLAKRPVGLNHMKLIENAFTVDSQWNESTQAVEALLFLPTPYINLIRARENTDNPIKYSVEYTWRNEKVEGDEVEFIGLVIDRVDLLDGLSAGDKYTSSKLIEGMNRRGLMEAEEVKIKQNAIQDSIEDPLLSFYKECEESANSFIQRLGEPFAEYKDFDDCLVKNKDKSNPSAYCGYIKHQVEDKKNKESSVLSILPSDSGIKESNLSGKKQVPEQPVNTMTTEEPSKLPVPTEQPQEHTNVTVVGAIPDNKGSPITPEPAENNPDKNLNQEPAVQNNVDGVSPKKGGNIGLSQENIEDISLVADTKVSKVVGDTGTVRVIEPIMREGKGNPILEDNKVLQPDKSNQSVECMDKLRESKEEVKVEPKKEEPKKEDIKVNDKPKEEVKVEKKKEDKPKEQETETNGEVTPDPKDVRIKELEGVVNTLQNNAKTTDTDKAKAVEAATKKAKEEVLSKIEKALPSTNIISNFNLGGQILARDIKKVILQERGE